MSNGVVFPNDATGILLHAGKGPMRSKYINFRTVQKVQNIQQNETQYSKTLALGTDSHLVWEAT